MKKILSLLMIGLFLVAMSSFSFCGQFQEGTSTQYPRGSINPGTIDTEIGNFITDPIGRVLTNHKQGCDVQYLSASTLTVALGEVVLTNSAETIRLMQSNSSATTITWNDIDTGAEETGKKYYIYAVQATATDSDFDIKISLSSTSPTGSTYFERLGSFFNNSDGNIERIDNDFSLSTPEYDSGWFSTSVDTNYTKAHSLSTIPIRTEVYVKGESSGTVFGGEPAISTTKGVDTHGTGFWWNVDSTNYYIRWKLWATRGISSSGTSYSINESVSVRILGWRY